MKSLFYNLLLGACCFAGLCSVQIRANAQGNTDWINLGKALDFRSDAMGNVYVISGAEVQKFSRNGVPGVRYSRKDLGKPTSIDVSNPLRILFFYAEFALIRITDNNLVDQSEIDLRSMGYLQPTAAAIAPDQGIWIFDEILGALVKIDTRLQSTTLSVNLVQLFGYRPQIKELAASREWVIARDAAFIHVFDLFGTKAMSIPLKSTPSLLQLTDNNLLFSENDSLIRVDLRTRTEQRNLLPCSSATHRAEWIEGKCRIIRDGTLLLEK